MAAGDVELVDKAYVDDALPELVNAQPARDTVIRYNPANGGWPTSRLAGIPAVTPVAFPTPWNSVGYPNAGPPPDALYLQGDVWDSQAPENGN